MQRTGKRFVTLLSENHLIERYKEGMELFDRKS